MSLPSTPALECDDVTAAFGNVIALSNVNLALAPGQIHVVAGQNGAGKTTFANVCAGVLRPTSGRVLFAGQEATTGNVGGARAAGVELVHQSFALPPSFTVAEALEFGSQRRNGLIYTRSKLEARWKEHAEALGVRARMSDRIRDLPVETQQTIEIARAMATDVSVLILDEPTAVLAPSAVDTLFDRLRHLRDNNVTIVLILHKIREVLAIADTVSVLHRGKLVRACAPASSVTANQLAELIVQSSRAEALPNPDESAATLLGAGDGPAKAPISASEAAMTFDRVTTGSADSEQGLVDVSFRVGRGEIVGIAGVEGNGQRALLEAAAGLAPLLSGGITLANRDVTAMSLVRRRDLGLRIIPFDRNTEGLSLSSALWENWAATALARGQPLRLVNPDALKRDCRAAFGHWSVTFTKIDDPAASLSGGNAQKVIFSREMDEAATMVLAAQPTRGLDVGATAFVWNALRQARSRGCGILLISSDLDELFEISDRIVVLLSGRIAGDFLPPYGLRSVGEAMTGVRP